jgi:phospholipid-binding lipoprotein MlaA
MSRLRSVLVIFLVPTLFFGSALLSFLPGPAGAATSLWAADDNGRGPDSEDAAAFAGKGNSDPYETANKVVFKFNEGLDQDFLKPFAEGYVRVTPTPFRRGVTNFFNNIEEPRIIMNDLLQGKVGHALGDTFRFAINTTIGIGGLFDIAKHAGLKRHEEDFGQTLAVWGVKESSYVMLPVLGPSTTRDTVGQIVDFFTYPLFYYHDAAVQWGLYGLLLINKRANLLTATDVLSEAAGEDRYEFIRESYFQSRKNQIYDGNPPLDLPYLIEEEPGGSSGAPAGQNR